MCSQSSGSAGVSWSMLFDRRKARRQRDYLGGVPHTPRDPDYERRVRESFARQAAMQTLGVTMARVSPGEVVLELPFRADLTQQHGFLHAGIVTSAMDSACGYSALTLMDPGAAVLSVEFKVNLLAPARGRLFRAIGRVVRAGRTVTVTSGELWAFEQEDVAAADVDARGPGTLVAMLTGTMMAVRDRVGLVD
jgi:uncharacterized protein (TIGR00369 family)